MATPSSISATTEVRHPEPCPHCFKGITYEPTEDTLVDEASTCHMCFGTAIRKTREERKAIKAERLLDMHYASLERMGG